MTPRLEIAHGYSHFSDNIVAQVRFNGVRECEYVCTPTGAHHFAQGLFGAMGLTYSFKCLSGVITIFSSNTELTSNAPSQNP